MSLPILDHISNDGSVSTVASLTWAQTVTVGILNAVLLAFIQIDNATVSNFTYAGAAMTLLASKVEGTFLTALYYKLGPVTGSNNFVLTPSTSALMGAAAADYSNVNQTTPFGTPVTSGGTSGTTSSNIIMTANTSQKVIDCLSITTSGVSPSSGQMIESQDQTNLAEYLADINATGSSMTLGWGGITGGNDFAQITVALNGIIPPASLYAPYVVPGSVIGANIWPGPPGLKYPSKMGPVIRRANNVFRNGGGLMGKNILRRKWWQKFWS